MLFLNLNIQINFQGNFEFHVKLICYLYLILSNLLAAFFIAKTKYGDEQNCELQ